MFTRNCPQCNKELFHTQKHNRDSAEKHKKVCMSCSKTGKHVGINNPFYGKTHSKETLDKINKNTDRSFMQTQEYKEKQRKSHSGNNNKMFGKSVYDIWVSKYGEEKANELEANRKLKLSDSFKGKNNPMFGKPSPKGSGNGWCGWYKDWHFRSLLELSFMINFVERYNFKWANGESFCKIPYSIDGQEKSYFPDIILNDIYLVEIKPKSLMNSRTNLAKREYAIEFCKENNLKYKVIEPKKLTDEQLKALYNEGKIKFTDKYETKYKNKYEK